MKLYQFILIFVLFLGGISFGQETIKRKSFDDIPKEQLRTDDFGNRYYYDKKQRARYYKINGETVIIMDELQLVRKPNFNNELDAKYYKFINRKLSRVYPLFLIALEQYRDINEEVSNIERKSEKRRYIKRKQKKLAEEYEQKLRNLTTTEGRVFAKLMSRATGKTVYEIIKELRGGWSAFWWNVKGNIADVDIKTAYNPRRDRSDAFLETLLQSHWNAYHLPPYPGYKDFKVKK
ncbi:MAG: molecular chaperone DnaJ [Flavobacteriales bacterium]|nr:MAG: molecular chaperone DnaJ [Flavobacteriales bacterium]